MQRSSRYASQFSEDNEVYLGIIDNELYVDNKPNVESANGEAEGLHRSSEVLDLNEIICLFLAYILYISLAECEKSKLVFLNELICRLLITIQ